MDFKVFKHAVAHQFESMKKHQLFRTSAEKDAMWDTYLSSFPAGSDPIYKERTEHNCNCCKQFIRAVGNVVAINKGKLMSIWDIKIPSEPEYQVVADALAEMVKSKPVENVFVHYEPVAGTDKNFQQIVDGMITWQHFHVNIPLTHVKRGTDIASYLGEIRAQHDVLLRSLNELTMDSVNTTLDLIAQNSLYRGADHKFAVESFKALKVKFDALKTVNARDLFVWESLKETAGSVSRIRNSAIGTLLQDLSADKDLEDAVKAFEVVMAPTNYKRPTALITKAMIAKAKEKLEELGLTSALERRYASLNDITVNNILFVDRSARKALAGEDVFADLQTKTKSTKSLDKVEEVPLEKFITDIVPKADTLEVLVENRLLSNLVSLVAPVDPTAGSLFKWDNRFSWSYVGDVADSIKERVKAAGGNVTGDLCCRLAWDYEDDLDFYMTEPGGYTIYFGNRRRLSSYGGMLDVDANGIDGIRQDPCENIVYQDRNKMRDGVYRLEVNNYNRRSSGRGFKVQVEFDGVKYDMEFDGILKSGQRVHVADIKYERGVGFSIIPKLPTSLSSQFRWGLKTQEFQKVNVLMYSPNYWDDQVGIGNKHVFFMLDGCANESVARGFYNEFLKEELNVHRKVFEAVGAKMKTDAAGEQLSGLGFSTTMKQTVTVRVGGSFNRIIKVVI